ncbi:rCG46591, isoform CRA_d [Rattus norvegicus]|uniref:RCG46591, isoform CRA_d n=1 Tax=Rattus norvegicus TaxID=10116 RepID=A6IXU4_RAT|nr:rCG46591, isoform CRA_d [Rattus norvegicus]
MLRPGNCGPSVWCSSPVRTPEGDLPLGRRLSIRLSAPSRPFGMIDCRKLVCTESSDNGLSWAGLTGTQ